VPVPDVDWVARFRDGFRALRSGRFLIAPAWAAPEPSPDVLLVDPGRAFGTGTHETTRLCLAALEELARLRPLGRTLDLG
jgi:ribosomal protein L11 methyltransferase